MIPLLWFSGAILSTFITWIIDDKHPGSKKSIVTLLIGILMMILSIIIAGINGYTKF